jgi:hypothetical protein
MLNFKINNNGDTLPTLMGQYKDICTAISALSEALNAAHPHGRNYQTCDFPTEDHREDTDKFMVAHAMLGTIRDLRDEFEDAIAYNMRNKT